MAGSKRPSTRRRPTGGVRLGPRAIVYGVALLAAATGCDRLAGNLFFDTATATGRTFIDAMLTAFANGIIGFVDLVGLGVVG